MRGATLVITAAALLGCAARTPRSAVGVRCVSRPPLRALRLQGGASDPAADDEEDEDMAESEDRDAADEPDAEDESEAPEVEEPDDEDTEPAPVSAASAPQAALGLNAGSLKASAMSVLSSLGLVPSTPSGEGVAEGEEQEQEGDMMSTLLTVAVFVGFRVCLSLAVRFFGRAAAEGGVTPMEQMLAALGSSPLGPLVKVVQQGWGSVAELARSPYAAPVVMSLMIVGLKLVGSMTDVEEADVTEAGGAAEGAEEEADGAEEEADSAEEEADGAEEEADGAAEEADGAAEAGEEEDAIDAAESEEE